MSKRGTGTIAGPFVMLPRSLLESTEWREQSINCRKLVDFLMVEHMRHAGRKNGHLVAPRTQLEAAGIGARHIGPAIDEAVKRGLVAVRRGSGRQPSCYALRWLPLGEMTSEGKSKERVATSEGKSLPMTSLRKPLGVPKGSHKAVGTSEGKSLQPVMTSLRALHEGKSPYRKSSTYQEKVDLSAESGETASPTGAAIIPLPRSAP